MRFEIFRTFILQLGTGGFLYFFKNMVLSGTGCLPSELRVLLKGDRIEWSVFESCEEMMRMLKDWAICTFEAVLCSRCSSMCHDLQ